MRRSRSSRSTDSHCPRTAPQAWATRSAAIDNNEVVATQGSNNVSESGFSLTVPAGASLGSLTLELVSASGKVVNAWVGYRNDAPGCACYFGNYMVG